MKLQLIVLSMLLSAATVYAQQSNEYRRPPKPRPEADRGPEKQQLRRIKLMHKALEDLGINEEQQAKIEVLQRDYSEKIRANAARTDAARKKLTELQNSSASREEIALAIDELSEAQRERMWILVDNRKEMEEILGKEKYAAFMEKARTQYRAHGRRGGLGMPPRPDMPAPPDEHEGRRPNPPPPRGDDGESEQDALPVPVTD